MRSQDWVIKIDYANGTGDGHVIWRLGQGGDFTISSSDPSPWFSHQHDVRYINDTTILVFDDGNTRRAKDPNADSGGQELVLDEKTMTAILVVTADLVSYSFALGATQMLPSGNLTFNCGIQGSRPNYFGQSIEVLPDGTKTFVQQVTGAEYRSYFVNNLYGTPTNILDPRFEDPMQGSGGSAYDYHPTGSSWTFSGYGGLSGNGRAFTSSNPNAPQASQVAFSQGTGTISQAVNLASAGFYHITLSAAQRANYITSSEAFQVVVDGALVSTITPAHTTHSTYTTASFNVAAGNRTISFVGVDPSGVDRTAFIDGISIVWVG